MRTIRGFYLFVLLLAGTTIVLAQQTAAPATPAKPAATPPAVKLVLPAKTRIITLVVEPFWQTNCYIVAGPTGQALVIDPADDLESISTAEKPDRYHPRGNDAKRIYAALTENKLTLKYMILTHGHLDHFGAIGYLKQQTGATIMMHEGDIRPKGDPFEGCPKDTRMFDVEVPKVDRALKEDDIISLDGMTLKVIHTPGHSPGSLCLLTSYQGKPLLFSGDTLLHYYKGWDGNTYDTGRTNFHDGSGNQDLLYRMIREKLFILPDETVVLPGHYAATTIGDEKKFSPATKAP